MPRLPRIHMAGLPYYVTQAGTNGRFLFFDEDDCNYYLDLLREYRGKKGFKVYAYALQAENLHLVVETGEETSLSEIMRDVTSRYSKYYNGKYDTRGPLFKGRYKTSLVEKGTALLTLIRYVHNLEMKSPDGVLSNSRSLYEPVYAGSDKGGRIDVSRERGELEKLFPDSAADSLEAALTGEMETAQRIDLEKKFKNPVIGSHQFAKEMQKAFEVAAKQPAPMADLPADLPAAAPNGGLRMAFIGGAFTVFAAAAVFTGFYFTGAVHKPEPVNLLEGAGTAVMQVPAGDSKQSTQAPLQGGKNEIIYVLNGTEWEVQLTLLDAGANRTVETDNIKFSENQLVSDNLQSMGFSPAHFTLSTKADGSLIWETMQRNESGALVSWRGEWSGEQMKGILSKQFANGESKKFHFVGVAKNA